MPRLNWPASFKLGIVDARYGALTLEDALDPSSIYLNPKDFGAKGDGVTDDAPSIQATIDAAAATGAGICVYFPSGTFLVGSTVRITSSGITLLGSPGATVKAATNLNTFMFDIAGTDGANITDVILNSLTIDGNLANQSSPGNQITTRFSFTQRCGIYDCVLLNGYDIAVFIRHSQRFIFRSNHVVGWRGTALMVSKFKDSADVGVSATKDVLVAANYFNANGLQAVPGNGVLTVVYSDSTAAIGANRVNNVTIEGNEFVGVNDTAIEIGIGTVRAAVIGNSIDGAGNGLIGGATSSTGISVDDAQFVTISGNVIGNYGGAAAVQQDGISMFRRTSPLATADVTIVGNAISFMPRYGIAINNNCINAVIANNLSIDAQTADIIIGSVGVTGIVQGFNAFTTAGASTSISPSFQTAAWGTLRFNAGVATIFVTNQLTPATGQALRTLSGNPTALEAVAGDASAYTRFRALVVYEQAQTLVYGAPVATDASLGSYAIVTVTNATAFTMSSPTNPGTAQKLTYDIYNNSGGAMGAITWGAAFKLAGAFTNPATGNHRTITFEYDGTNWRELCRAAADIPN